MFLLPNTMMKILSSLAGAKSASSQMHREGKDVWNCFQIFCFQISEEKDMSSVSHGNAVMRPAWEV